MVRGLHSSGVVPLDLIFIVYYIPIWFQSVKGVEAVQSGIRLLPLMLSIVVASISGGFINQKIGYYTPLGIAGVWLMSIGSGLLTTLHVDTGPGKCIGSQVLYGLGMGLCFQTPNLATQAVLPKPDVPMGLALMFFGQLLGAAVFVSIGQNVLDNQLIYRLSDLPGFSNSLVSSGGAASLLEVVHADQRETVLTAYNEALRKVFQIGLILSCLASLGVFLMEWRSLKKTQPMADTGKSEVAEEKEDGQTI